MKITLELDTRDGVTMKDFQKMAEMLYNINTDEEDIIINASDGLITITYEGDIEDE